MRLAGRPRSVSVTIPIHEAAHALVGRSLGFEVKGITLSEDEGSVILEIPETYDREERACGKLLVTLAGTIAEYLDAGRNPVDALHRHFSSTDQAVMDQATNVLGKKAREQAVAVLEVVLSQ